MTTNIEQFASAGLDNLWWAVNVSGGSYPYGTAGTIANGSDAGMGRLLGVQSLSVQIPQPRRANSMGDDGTQASWVFQPIESPTGDLVLGVFDLNFVAKSQGAKVYADGDFDTVAMFIENATYNQMTIVTNSQAKSRMSGSSGEAGWLTKIYPRVQVVPLGDAGLENGRETTFTHALTIDKSDKKPWGTSFSTTNDGTASAGVITFFSNNRVTMHTHVSDASDLTFTLSKLPAAASAAKVKAWRNGTALTYTTDFTVNASTGVVTLVSAGTAGDVVVVRYEYLES